MLTKKDLIKNFQKNPELYWKVTLFDDLGFKRKQCINCGKFFWTLTDQKICNDSTCRPYDFIGNPPTKKAFGFFETWEAIEKFFIKNKHTKLERYPVICRWFNLYFTIAGIVNFYRLTNSKLSFEFPANPSILLQPCLRFNDIPNTGINGKSYTSFGMIQQSSLYNGKEGYWKDECIDLDFKLLTRVFGINPEEIVFIEDTWLGPSAFGSSLEYHVQGLELGNAVFTEFTGTPDHYKEMEDKIIDMGAGFERFVWISNGTPTSYDVAFGPIVKKLMKVCDVDYDKNFFLRYAKLAGSLNLDETPDMGMVKKQIAQQLKVSVEELNKQVEPIESIYALADHTRTLAFAISDGGILSNVAGGYNLRVILRRALSFIDKFKWDVKIEDVIFWHVDYLKKMFPDLFQNKGEIAKILDVEREKYRKTKERSKRIIASLAGKKMPEEEMIKLYDSEGITPEELGIEIPGDFYEKVTEKHVAERPTEEKPIIDVSGLPATKLLFYEDENRKDFIARVLKIINNKYVILDQTCFYPRSGGEEPDSGFINGCVVYDVEKVGNVVVHLVENPNFREGSYVNCVVDWQRREQLTKHHTAVHIINASSRRILGSHVWQHSAFKDFEKARLDITHYEALSDKEIDKMENLANKIVEKSIPIKKSILPRNEAEKRYGFRIYQGGAVPEKELRIVEIPGIDVEACGGTHLNNTKDTGKILITSTERIQDGIDRINIVAGDAAKRYLEERKELLNQIENILDVRGRDTIKATKKIFNEWKKLRKKIKERIESKAERISKNLEKKFINNVLIEKLDANMEMLQEISRILSSDDRVILLFGISDKIYIFGSAGSNTGKNIEEIIKGICSELGGKGGGSPQLGQGIGLEKDKLDSVIKKLREELK